MRLLQSTTARIAALVFVLQLGAAGTLLVAVRLLTTTELTAFAQSQAVATRDALTRGNPATPSVLLAERITQSLALGRSPGSVMLLVDGAGRRLAGNLATWPAALPASQGGAMTELLRIGRDKSERMRIIVTPVPGGGRLLTGHVIEIERHFTVLLGEALLSAIALAVALAVLAGWITARLIENRLRVVVDTARTVAMGDLGQRVPLDGGGDAFAELGTAVNMMLDRITMLMTELKVATDGLAHDLRSPLTRLRSTLERALALGESEAARALIERGMDEGDRLLAMLDTALRITRAEAGLGREGFVSTDIGAMIADIAEVYGPVAEDLGVTIRTETEPGLVAMVHRELLGQTLANLIDNALKYGVGPVDVRARNEADRIVVGVSDRGPGIAAADHHEALRRFGRLDAARSSTGAGLGLPLAAAVARLHGGSLALNDNLPGLWVTITLPAGTPKAKITSI
ncbi:HAMP domain-containing sensor histidine kinase [Sphingomonas sp. BIUV-7]|uniref:histidine kinase n=1 Tax=Sphingomonas natans TaxID=3063330 RepID=A0ABT8YDY7_9SPHN|nr:HAMP domain-containing sensor histidine kinase [Sphingomonas sp. BIUV-7]MDO6415859.1 HAMP domain-containing sensor histidine kinase [Sphingomonas sp. BIUV-7]